MACPNSGIQIIRSILLKVAYQIRRKYPEVLKRISKSWISNFNRLRQIPPPFRDVAKKTRFNYTRWPARFFINKNPKMFPILLEQLNRRLLSNFLLSKFTRGIYHFTTRSIKYQLYGFVQFLFDFIPRDQSGYFS